MNRALMSIATAAALLVGVAGFTPWSANAATTAARPAAATTAKPAAVRCHDAKGRFTKCQAAVAKPKTCRDAKGKFTKCAA